MKNLKIALLAGAVLFFLIGTAHLTGIKIPGLYIYFDLQSYAYQDLIISALAFGWAIFFFTAFKSPIKILLKAILLSGIIAICILTFINIRETVSVLAKIETTVLFLYWLWLIICYHKLSKNNEI